jgi:hypothetical protein
LQDDQLTFIVRQPYNVWWKKMMMSSIDSLKKKMKLWDVRNAFHVCFWLLLCDSQQNWNEWNFERKSTKLIRQRTHFFSVLSTIINILLYNSIEKGSHC